MNSKQLTIITSYAKDINTIMNKMAEMDKKFFDNSGLFNEKNPRINGELEIGIYISKTGQAVKLDDELKLLARKFILDIKQYYQNKLDNMDVEALMKLLVDSENEANIDAEPY